MQKDEKTPLTVGPAEFAEIVGVQKQVVSNAIARGRFKRAVVSENGKRKIKVYEGCVEWYLNKQVSKDRTEQADDDIQESRKRKEYYQSLLAKLEYEIKAKAMIPVALAAQTGLEVILTAKYFLYNSQDVDCYKMLGISDAFEARQFLKERDNKFLRELSNLTTAIEKYRESLSESVNKDDL